MPEMRFTITLAYTKDTETVFKVLTDKSYLIKKFEYTGAKNISIPVCAEKNDTFVVTRKLDILFPIHYNNSFFKWGCTTKSTRYALY